MFYALSSRKRVRVRQRLLHRLVIYWPLPESRVQARGIQFRYIKRWVSVCVCVFVCYIVRLRYVLMSMLCLLHVCARCANKPFEQLCVWDRGKMLYCFVCICLRNYVPVVILFRSPSGARKAAISGIVITCHYNTHILLLILCIFALLSTSKRALCTNMHCCCRCWQVQIYLQ